MASISKRLTRLNGVLESLEFHLAHAHAFQMLLEPKSTLANRPYRRIASEPDLRGTTASALGHGCNGMLLKGKPSWPIVHRDRREREVLDDVLCNFPLNRYLPL